MYRKMSLGRTMLIMFIVSVIINMVDPLIIQNFLVFSIYCMLFCLPILYIVDLIELRIHHIERKYRDEMIKEKIVK